ncbi:DNA gyrase inhibitor YacG [Novosphingobium fluoreni]|uniref:DNA gyrase inhibitor YacG n=1 Tax=Novosphingobium fluoreni TaxID=1391222 RepID=UPI003DA082AE
MARGSGEANRPCHHLAGATGTCAAGRLRSGNLVMTRPERPCPVCRKPRSAEFSPFCSSRCRDRDLMQWLEEGYSIPGRAAPPANSDED